MTFSKQGTITEYKRQLIILYRSEIKHSRISKGKDGSSIPVICDSIILTFLIRIEG